MQFDSDLLNMARRPGRLWRTVRHLRFTQIYGRVRVGFPHPRVDRSPAPLRRELCDAWSEPAERKPSLVARNRFRFLIREAELDAVGWDGQEQSRLWRYNEHYFDDLTSEGWRDREGWHCSLVSRW